MALPQQAARIPLDILVIGAGLAGLSAAISCAQAGHNVRVLEAAKELAEVGAGLQITPNACKLFHEWGIFDRLEPLAAETLSVQTRRYSDGKMLARADNFNVEMKRKYHAPLWGLHRVDLQKALAERAQELGIRIVLSAKVEDVDFQRTSVRLQDEQELTADLIIGADGLWSKCRQCFLATKGLEDRPLPTGDLAYRIMLKPEDVDDQDLKDWIQRPKLSFWIGPNSHVVAYSVRNGQMINIVLLVPDDLPADVTRQTGSLEEMRAIFQNWDPTLNRFLDHVKSVDKWKLMHRPELDTCIEENFTFVIIGDACHPMLPYLAQGANVSLEDGAVLGHVLAAVETRVQLPQALKLYQRLRKGRGAQIARESFATRATIHLPDGPEQQARDEIMLSRLGKELDCKFPIRFQCPEVQPWLFGYDARAETESGLKDWLTLE